VHFQSVTPLAGGLLKESPGIFGGHVITPVIGSG
jgi:hypothetical protein